MTDPKGLSPVLLADEIGVSRSSSYRWISAANLLDIAVNAEPPTFTEFMQRLTTMERRQ